MKTAFDIYTAAFDSANDFPPATVSELQAYAENAMRVFSLTDAQAQEIIDCHAAYSATGGFDSNTFFHLVEQPLRLIDLEPAKPVDLPAVPESFYVLYSPTSRHSSMGMRPLVARVKAKDIVEWAAIELLKEGGSLEDLAGVSFVEDEDGSFTPERPLMPHEIMTFSVEKLGDDGRMYRAFDSKKSVDAFIAAAEDFGLGDDARKLVGFISDSL